MTDITLHMQNVAFRALQIWRTQQRKPEARKEYADILEDELQTIPPLRKTST